ncbi:hypothetical protein KKH56_01810 [bacterium]|nr:hypothetical protein [bacterium]
MNIFKQILNFFSWLFSEIQEQSGSSPSKKKKVSKEKIFLGQRGFVG